MNTPMMKCGHAANAHRADGTQCCAICIGLDAGATIIMETPILEGRMAKCDSCKNEEPSDTSLAFFEYRPNEAYDKYYCGCEGYE
jgi:hypothetical protein